MSQNLEIPDPIFNALQQAATASGTTPVGWIAAHLPPAKAPADNTGARPKTLADMFAGRIGGISSDGKETYSQNCGERFTKYILAAKAP